MTILVYLFSAQANMKGKDDSGRKKSGDGSIASLLHVTTPKKVKVYKVDRNVTKYAKGALKFRPKEQKYKGLRKKLQETTERIVDAAVRTAETEVLLPSHAGFIRPEGNEKTYKLKQQEIVQEVDLNTAKNAMDLHLTKFGPYRINYSKNGR
jgi:U3 small nucleolar RNA-associated protein 7